VQASLKTLQCLSRAVLFSSVPGTRRRKRLSKKTMGLT